MGAQSRFFDDRPRKHLMARGRSAKAKARPHFMIRKRIVIIGAGFGGIETALGLGGADADVTLIDRQNYHLFQPLLYQVATAALSPADIAEPVRRMLRAHTNLEAILGEVTKISTDKRCVMLADGSAHFYDILVIAAGATHTYFGHDAWAPFAPSLKTIADARHIRSQLLLAFERAEMSADLSERERLMTFVVVGGGPSGVELAGSIAELARHTLVKDFHRIDPKTANVLLLEAGAHILSAFPPVLSNYAVEKLTSLGVTVRENCAVKDIAAQRVTTDDGVIPAGLVLWTAGVKASPLAQLLGVPTVKSGHIETRDDLSVPDLSDVYALGDIALVRDRKGKPLPGLAQVAKQQGQYLGRALAQKIRSGKTPRPFVFHNRGNVAVIGRHGAVMDFGWLRVTGSPAWLLWALIHIYLLAGLQHRLQVAVQWLWRYATYDRGARLIVEPIAPSGGEGGEPC
jgi:NADH dehydrogenase